MGKKDLSALMSGIMGQEEERSEQQTFPAPVAEKTQQKTGKRGRPKNTEPFARSSFYVEPEILKKIKYICLLEEITQTDALKEALTAYIDKWERKNGAISIPDKK